MNRGALPTLYHRGKKGDIYSWEIWTEDADIVTVYGLVDGLKQTARKTATPKNVGRSNETRPAQQADIEAAAMWQKKLDRKYATTPEAAEEELIRPMLAHDFEKRKDKNVTYPVLVQPKLDGVRALAFWDGDKIELMSRSGKSWRDVGSVEHIAKALETLLPKGRMFDGEIYAHGESFQQTTRLVKKFRPGPEGSVQLVFHVYDVLREDDLDRPFLQRTADIAELGVALATNEDAPTVIEIVESCAATSEEQVYQLQSKYLSEGYEGAMVRTMDGDYRYGYRSHDLLKVKTFMDAEYVITSVEQGVGKFEESAIFVCSTADNKEFRVTPVGTMEERREMYANAPDYIGQALKVKFFEYTEDGIPRFPVGLGVRLPEDA